MKFSIFFLLFTLTSCVTAQNSNSSVSNNQTEIAQEQKIIDVSLCDLIQNPEKFEQKLIRVKAIYRYGFEWSELYSLKCETKKRVWVEDTEKKCDNADKVDEMENAGMGGRTVGIIAVGQFTGEKKGYGHMNEFDYLFKIKCFEKAEFLDKKGYVPNALTPKQKSKVEDFENSK